MRLDKIDADFREYEHQRLIEFGYYLPEEVGMLQSKIGAAQSTAMASLLGEPKGQLQMSNWQHAAATDPELEDFALSTIRDRVMKAGIELPANPAAAIDRLFALRSRPDVLIGIKPGDKPNQRAGPYAEDYYEVYEHAVPLNDAAIKYFGGNGDQPIRVDALQPVTLNDLLGRTKPTSTSGFVTKAP